MPERVVVIRFLPILFQTFNWLQFSIHSNVAESHHDLRSQEMVQAVLQQLRMGTVALDLMGEADVPR